MERWSNPEMDAEERAKADSEATQIESMAKACDWDFYCAMGIKVDSEGKFHISTHAKGSTEHLAVMISALVQHANSATISQGVSDGTIVTGREPELPV